MICKLVKKGICPNCDFGVLLDEIPLGTEYNIYPKSIVNGFMFICGGCGTKVKDVTVVRADSRFQGKPAGILPLALFDYVS